jgi:hypothetical protein
MDALQLRYLKVVLSGPKHNYCIFFVPNVNEMLRNTPKHHFGSNVVEWMPLKFGAQKKGIEARNTRFASFYVPKVSEMLRNSAKHHFGSNVVEWMLRNFASLK